MLKRSATAIVMFMILIPSLTMFAQRVSAATATLKLDPPSVIDETLTPGKTVVMTVQVADVQNLIAYEFQAYFDNTVLNATKVIRPSGHFLEPANPANQFVPAWEIKNDFNATHGRLFLSFTLLYPETGRSGSGTLVEITFNILNISSTLISFEETVLADDTGTEIVHNTENGFFSNLPAPPPPPPPMPAHVYVDPPDITDPTLTPSSNFTIQVSIANATDVYSLEFKLNYNPSTVKTLELHEGSFLKKANSTFSIITINNTEGFVALNSTLTSLPAISGDGNIAVIEFNVLETGSTPLTISEFVLRNSTGQALNATITNGHFSNIALEGDVNGDGIVDIRDLDVAALAFGATPDDPRWNPAADLNSDGIINVLDLVAILKNFGSVIPEYSSYVMLLIFMVISAAAILALLKKKRISNLRT